MNLIFLGIIIFIILILVLSWFAKANTKKISKNIRFLIVIFSLAYWNYITGSCWSNLLAAPYTFSTCLPLIKLQSGMSLFKALMIFRLLNRLRQQGRFSYTSGTNYSSRDQAVSTLKRSLCYFRLQTRR